MIIFVDILSRMKWTRFLYVSNTVNDLMGFIADVITPAGLKIGTIRKGASLRAGFRTS